MGKANRGMFPGTPATEIITCNNNVTGFRIAAERRVKIGEKQWYNCRCIGTHNTVCMLAGKHLVGIEIVNIGIVPYIPELPVFSCRNEIGCPLRRIERKCLISLQPPGICDDPGY